MAARQKQIPSSQQLWSRILRGLSPFHAIVALTPEMPEKN
jgi:hypothetical protein